MIDEGQVRMQRVVVIARFADEPVLLECFYRLRMRAIPYELPLALAAWRKTLRSHGDESRFVFIKTLHCSRDGFLGMLGISRSPGVGSHIAVLLGFGADMFICLNCSLVGVRVREIIDVHHLPFIAVALRGLVLFLDCVATCRQWFLAV